MEPYVVGMVCIAVLVAASLVANRRLISRRELPMHFNLGGRPTWYAPWPVALAVMPALATIFLLAPLLGTHESLRHVSMFALAFIVAHALHLALIFRHPGR
jgi:hypothetical protein